MNAKLHYNTTNEMKTHFDNLLKQLSYSSFIENDDFVNILNTNKEKITEFGDFTSINNYYIKYKISFPNAENYGLGGPTVSTRFWKLVYPIISWLNNKEKQHKINNECLEIINQLQKYGLYSHFKIDDKYNYTIDDIKRLTKELEEYETAEENARKIVKDEYIMKQLKQNPNFIGWMVNRTDPEKAYSVNITKPIKEYLGIRPAIARTPFEEQVERIARQRLEAKKLEDAVQKRMAELMHN